MNDRRITSYLFIFLLSLYLLTSSLRIDSGDGETMYQVAYSLVAGNRFAIPVDPITTDAIGPWGVRIPAENLKGGDTYGMWGRDGKYYGKYGIGWSLGASPFVLIGRGVAKLHPSFSVGYVTRAFVMFLNPLLTAGSGALIYILSRKYYSTPVSIGLSLIYGTCTIAWYYATSAFSEPLIVFLLLAAIWLIFTGRYWWTGVALGSMLVVRQTAIFLLVPVLAWEIYRKYKHNQRTEIGSLVTKIGLPVLIGQSIVFFYNHYRFGNIFETGYLGVAWDTPLLFGLYSQLFSSGKGLLVFSPIIIFGLLGWIYPGKNHWKSLSLGIFIFYLIPHSIYRDWGGGGGWGPRLLLPVIPAILLSSGEFFTKMNRYFLGRIFLVVFIALSICIQLLGVTVNWARHLQSVYNDSTNSIEFFYRVHYRWPDSPILGQSRSLIETLSIVTRPETRNVMFQLVDSLRMTENTDWHTSAIDVLSINIPDFWFIYMWFLGFPLLFIYAGMVLILLLFVYSGIRLRQLSYSSLQVSCV